MEVFGFIGTFCGLEFGVFVKFSLGAADWRSNNGWMKRWPAPQRIRVWEPLRQTDALASWHRFNIENEPRLLDPRWLKKTLRWTCNPPTLCSFGVGGSTCHFQSNRAFCLANWLSAAVIFSFLPNGAMMLLWILLNEWFTALLSHLNQSQHAVLRTACSRRSQPKVWKYCCADKSNAAGSWPTGGERPWSGFYFERNGLQNSGFCGETGNMVF